LSTLFVKKFISVRCIFYAERLRLGLVINSSTVVSSASAILASEAALGTLQLLTTKLILLRLSPVARAKSLWLISV